MPRRYFCTRHLDELNIDDFFFKKKQLCLRCSRTFKMSQVNSQNDWSLACFKQTVAVTSRFVVSRDTKNGHEEDGRAGGAPVTSYRQDQEVKYTLQNRLVSLR